METQLLESQSDGAHSVSDSTIQALPQETAMSERTFLIQRYCVGNWPAVSGDVPFFATGPEFQRWAYGLERYGEWRVLPALAEQLEAEFLDDRFQAAAALLQLGIVQALWVEHTDVPHEDWMSAAVSALVDEIPKDGPLGGAVEEYLSGLAGPGHFRSYVAEDRIELVPMGRNGRAMD